MPGRKWTQREESELVIANAIQPDRVCIHFAKRVGRTPRSVRVKLCRLLKEPINRPPTMTSTASPDAAAPRLPTARGPDGTSDRD